MKHMTRRARLVGGAILVLLAAMAPRLIEWMAASRLTTVVNEAHAVLSTQSTRQAASIAANETAVLEDIRNVIRAQTAYRAVNQGFYAGRLACLASPRECIPFYPPNAPSLLEGRLATGAAESGYHRSFTAGTIPPRLLASMSLSSVTGYRYDAWPVMVGHTGVRAFAADATGRICFTPDGAPVSKVVEDKLEPTCNSLECIEPPLSSVAAPGPPLPDLRVKKSSVEPIEGQRFQGEPLYTFAVVLENTNPRPVVLFGVRRLFFAPGAVGSGSGSTMGTRMTIAPGATLDLGGGDAPAALSRAEGPHFLVLAVRYGDAEDYRTNRGQTVVFRWAGAKSGVVPRDLLTPPEGEAARVRKEVFSLGGWWGDSGPEQRLPAGLFDHPMRADEKGKPCVGTWPQG